MNMKQIEDFKDGELMNVAFAIEDNFYKETNDVDPSIDKLYYKICNELRRRGVKIYRWEN